MCDLDDTGESSIFKIIRNASVLSRMLTTFDLRRRLCGGAVRRRLRVGSGTDHWSITLAEVLKLQRRGQFPDELVKIPGEGIVIIITTIFSNFVSVSLIK